MTTDRKGLSSAEAQRLLAQYGPNAVEEERPHPLRLFLRKLWGPVPWMLELTWVLEVALGKAVESVIIAFLLLFNAILGFSQEHRARNALELLRSRLQIMARVLRDGAWIQVPAAELVPGDYVHLRVGDFAPADFEVGEGHVLVDQSALTGESAPAERGPGDTVYSGSILRRGEASGTVTATGGRSYFGKTAELVRGAGSRGHLEGLVLSIVRYLVLMDGLLVAAILVYATIHGMGLEEILPFALILLVASVPVAMPATFTLATAIASLTLAGKGVLVTRLAAIEEAAAMSELCSDKTGTLTLNRLTLTATRPAAGVADDTLLAMAALASDEATQDPLDMAILRKTREKGLPFPARISFVPFDPSTKRSEASFVKDGETWQAMKGAPQVVAQLAPGVDWEADAEALAAEGARVLAVAGGPQGHLQFLGLLALSDPPRPEARDVVGELGRLGVNVRMVTGDSAATARAVAAALGMREAVCAGREAIHGGSACDIYAGVYPEDKFHLVQTLQKEGRTVGMTGDGVNDAPALKQAEVGIAVASATDVAKAAASLVLTQPGLGGVVTAVETGRRVYQRLLTYTLNKIVKTFQVALFLSLGLLIFHQFVVTPLLVLLLLFANDFVTMSIAGDRVRFSPGPDRWNVRVLVETALVLAGAWLVYIFAVFLAGRLLFDLPLPPLQTLGFLGLVFSGLANVFLVRERSYLWASRPGRFLLMASGGDVVLVCLLAGFGWLMAPLPWPMIGALLLFTVAYVLILDQVKVPLLRRLAHPGP